MKQTLALLAGALALTGCTTIEDNTAAPRDTCQAEPGQRFISRRGDRGGDEFDPIALGPATHRRDDGICFRPRDRQLR